tara:strand:- start:248 stop:433 length:186 start_codon:yes stop_codon:yes gene_type:complete
MSQAVKNYFSMRKFWKKWNDHQSIVIWREEYRRELYLDKNLVTLRYKKPKRPKGLGWLDDC